MEKIQCHYFELQYSNCTLEKLCLYVQIQEERGSHVLILGWVAPSTYPKPFGALFAPPKGRYSTVDLFSKRMVQYSN